MGVTRDGKVVDGSLITLRSHVQQTEMNRYGVFTVQIHMSTHCLIGIRVEALAAARHDNARIVIAGIQSILASAVFF
jgi:hypothetical protein